MSTLTINSGIKRIDLAIISSLFDTKASSLEELEEHSSGNFSTQQRIIELKAELLNFVSEFKNRNSMFYIFLNNKKEKNLKIVTSSVIGDLDDTVKRFAIVFNEDSLTLDIEQESLSGKRLISILND
jgi:hypothetical protein